MASLREITPEELKGWSGGSLQLIDVRNDGEVQRGVIPGMVHIPMHLVPVRTEELDPGRPVVVYCASGARSAQVGHYLVQNGFGEVYNLIGGIQDWAQQYPLTAPQEA
ncbi:rhodanese-like domain-containing protein [Thiohalorhabdus sp. Cl-TMA]|uniref:Rhodanese-like domain-containing protein n=1 Tax=Thiohalorhabdus methylotrophus TaxID=3242694 RepID=A0ABV4TTH2_9GAMM